VSLRRLLQLHARLHGGIDFRPGVGLQAARRRPRYHQFSRAAVSVSPHIESQDTGQEMGFDIDISTEY
jgi:hypothetical protein